MGDIIYIEEYKRRKAQRMNYEMYSAEMIRLGGGYTIWTAYDVAVERQRNRNWMELFFYPDWDW